jgi:catechol 2,3-dioxygenase-like lactoylglutathione lyase family enzyme
MPRLDHIELPVRDWQESRNWYRDKLGFGVEMEFPDQRTVGLRDDADLTIFMHQSAPPVAAPGFTLTVQVADVDEAYRKMSSDGVAFEHPPRKVYWGYGAELLDPSGYRLRLWDELSMKEKG